LDKHDNREGQESGRVSRGCTEEEEKKKKKKKKKKKTTTRDGQGDENQKRAAVTDRTTMAAKPRKRRLCVRFAVEFTSHDLHVPY
jgi:hypothetical protein